VVGFAYAVVRANITAAITRMEHTALKLRRHGALVHLADGGRADPSPGPLCDDPLATDGCRASCQPHPVQDGHADGGLSLLGREAAGSQPGSHQRFVAAHCCFYVTAQVLSLEGGIDRSRLSTSQRVNGTAR